MSNVIGTVEPAIAGSLLAGSSSGTLGLIALVVGVTLLLMQEWDE